MKFCMVCGRPIESVPLFGDERFCLDCGAEKRKALQAAYRRQFGARLKQARERAGLSRKELANATGITANGFGLYETGKRDISVTLLICFARELNVSVDWLIGIDDKHDPKI